MRACDGRRHAGVRRSRRARAPLCLQPRVRVAQEHRLDFVDAFDGAPVQRVLGCRDLLPVAILLLGYAAGTGTTPRRSLGDLVHDNELRQAGA